MSSGELYFKLLRALGGTYAILKFLNLGRESKAPGDSDREKKFHTRKIRKNRVRAREARTHARGLPPFIFSTKKYF